MKPDKIRVKKWWLPNGTIVLDVTGGLEAVPRPFFGNTPLRRKQLYSVQLPRATPKAEVRLVMRNLKMMFEAKEEAV